MTTIGHFVVGTKMFLTPMLQADFEPVARKVMHSVFHYVSVFLILSCAILLLAGTGTFQGQGISLLVWFIALNYGLFAVWQLVIAMTSGISKAPTKLFQWVFFVLISGFAVAGTL